VPLFRAQASNSFLYGLVSRAQPTQPQWVRVGIDLLHQLECFEVEHKDLVIKHYHQHLLPQLDVLDVTIIIECDLRPILLLMIVPDHYLILLLAEHQHYNVGLVHHLDQLDTLRQSLTLLLQLV
jgi:hypothetical protein